MSLLGRRTGHRRPLLLSVAALAVIVCIVGINPQIARAGPPTISSYGDASINSPFDIATGSDNALWFTNVGNNSIGRISTGGVVSNYTGTGINAPLAITAGPDGALWFTNSGNNSIGRITTGGVVSNYTGTGINGPFEITAGLDGALWFTNNGGSSSIGRITTAGVVSNYTDPSIVAAHGITAGPDGALWFTDGNSVGRITTGGAVTNYPAGISNLTDITTGSDGNLWFTVFSGVIGRITTTGVVSTFSNGSVDDPIGITDGPDGALWYPNQGAFTIGSITTGVAAGQIANSHSTCPSKCTTAVAIPATTGVPAQSIEVVGTPTTPPGTVDLNVAFGSLICPAMDPGQAPIADLTDSGFSPTSRLTLTVVLKNTARPKSKQVCFYSTVPFRNQGSPSVPMAGTALLLRCSKTHHVAPCLKSSKQSGANVVVTFYVPGGDPRFHVTDPSGLSIVGPQLPASTLSRPYTAHLAASGGIGPYHWKLSSGSLPPGIKLKASTGALSGAAKRTGTYSFVISVSDHEKPPLTFAVARSITVVK